MRVFIIACVAAGVIAVVAALALNAVPDTAKVAFSTVGVRL